MALATWSLLRDRSLNLAFDEGAGPLVQAWIPLSSGPARGMDAGVASPDIALILVTSDARRSGMFRRPADVPTLDLSSLAVWLDSSSAIMRHEEARVHGRVDLPRLRADIEVDPQCSDRPGATLEVALTVAAGLLLNRSGRVLMHAGCFLAPDGGAWLLVGDSQSGKTSTCANLIRAGWSYLSDDHVVLSDGGDCVDVEGWLRRFNLDDGFSAGASVRVRTPVDSSMLGSGAWVRSARLAGVLFPFIDEACPTLLQPIGKADTMSGLIRQAPWVLSDRVAAPVVLRLLQRIVSLPAHRLRLGWDAYRDPAVLVEQLRPVIER